MDTSRLQGILPEGVYSSLDSIINTFEINSELRLAHFLSQASHESGGFHRTTENLNYSAEGLLKTFHTHFNQEQAEEYSHQPERIANRIYANRLGNGDEESGDGYAFRGRGYIQLTGRSNYQNYGDDINEDIISNPDCVAEPNYALSSAAWFWTKNNINAIADEGDDSETCAKVRHKVNGGHIGLEETEKLFTQFYNLLTNNAL